MSSNTRLRAEYGAAKTTHPPAVLHQREAVLNGGRRVQVSGLQTQSGNGYMLLIDYTNSIRLVYSQKTRLFVNRNSAAVTDVVVYLITGYLTISFTMRSHGYAQCTRACTAIFQFFI